MCSARPDTRAQLAVSATSAMFLCIFQKMGVNIETITTLATDLAKEL